MNARDTEKEIATITRTLIEWGVSNEQNFPALHRKGNCTDVTISGAPDLSASLRNVGYRELYLILESSRAYNIRMLDGGLIQMLYRFSRRSLHSHRLAYFPSPDFIAFQNDEALYLNDEMFADILEKSVLPCPLRFDYEESSLRHVDILHPKSHLTIGQYHNCRIPVSSALTPGEFVIFLMRCFYGSAYKKYGAGDWTKSPTFGEVITELEQTFAHIRLCHPKHANRP